MLHIEFVDVSSVDWKICKYTLNKCVVLRSCPLHASVLWHAAGVLRQKYKNWYYIITNLKLFNTTDSIKFNINIICIKTEKYFKIYNPPSTTFHKKTMTKNMDTHRVPILTVSRNFHVFFYHNPYTSLYLSIHFINKGKWKQIRLHNLDGCVLSWLITIYNLIFYRFSM